MTEFLTFFVYMPQPILEFSAKEHRPILALTRLLKHPSEPRTSVPCARKRAKIKATQTEGRFCIRARLWDCGIATPVEVTTGQKWPGTVPEKRAHHQKPENIAVNTKQASRTGLLEKE